MADSPPINFLLHGSVNSPPPRRALQAGPLTLGFEAGDLRYLKLGNREIIRRIYAAVRDRNWGTVPAELSDLRIDLAGGGFHIRYTSTHQQGDIHFVWQAEIEGAVDGSISFVFDGEAKSSFLRNRIGLCVLHPIRECAGAKCRALYPNGTEHELAFPAAVAAEQPVRWLHDLVGLAHEVEPGIWAELRFSGDVFEMEDQRNWIDASFKTFCTPLRLPRPMAIKAGTRVRQKVELQLVAQAARLWEGRASSLEFGASAGFTAAVVAGETPAWRHRHDARANGTANIIIRLRGGSGKLPPLGLCSPSHQLGLHEEQVRRLCALKLAHLRVDLRLQDPDWHSQLLLVKSEACDLNARLEAALHLDVSPGRGLKDAAETLGKHRESFARVLLFQQNHPSTTAEALAAARKYLGKALDGIPFGCGTNGDLYQLNLNRPPADADFICWSMNPQVHAFDNSSIAETPEAAAQQVASVRDYFPGKPLVVSPVTLRPRFNPNATEPEPAAPPGQLPPQVDPRQLSLFGAAWTLAMVKSLAEAGADSMTFYETIGWRGVLEATSGSRSPELFPSIAGAVFPLYHVLADVGEFAGSTLSMTESSNPLAVASILLHQGEYQRLMLANLSPEPRRVALEGLPNFETVRVLDAGTARSAMSDPETFRESRQPFGSPAIELPAHAVATLDTGS